MEKKLKKISIRSVKRLPLYYSILKECEEREFISATELARRLNAVPIQVRKDLAMTGAIGQPKLGFKVKELIAILEEFLGWNNASDAFLIGAGNLGRALINYRDFKTKGLNIVAAFDNDPEKINTEIDGCKILPIKKISSLTQRLNVRIAVLTTPGQYAQKTAEILTTAGVTAIWNFTPVKLNVAKHIVVEDVRLASSLSVLTSKLHKQLNT